VRGPVASLGALALVVVLSLGATSAFGETPPSAASEDCPNAGYRIGPSSNLPDCRAYEQVSPANKSGGAVKFDLLNQSLGGYTQISPSGDRALFVSYSAFADASGSLENQYQSERSGQGSWTTVSVAPEPTRFQGIPSAAAAEDASDELTTTITNTPGTYDPLDADGSPGPFAPRALVGGQVDVYTTNLNGEVEWASRGNEDLPDAEETPAVYLGRSSDAGHVVFSIAELGLVPPAVGPAQVAGENIYDRHGGHTYLVGVDSAGRLTSPCGAGQEGTPQGVIPSVSSTGNVAFVSPDPLGGGDPSCSEPRQVYLRIDDERTVDVSASQLTVPEPGPPASAHYRGISPNGEHVFFTSEDRLTDEAPAGGGLYEFDVPTGELQLRAAGVNFEFGSSWILQGHRYSLITEDGSRLYLVSHLKLTSDAPEAGGLYLLDHQHLEYVLPFNEGGNPAALPQMSADGTTLAFLSTQDLTSYESGGQSEVYLYHAGTGEVDCASCSPSGAAPSGPASFSSSPTARYPANLSTDGTRVFFESPDRLTTGDSNSNIDVYEYENHHVALISSGHGSQAERFAGASADGSDVLFSSNEALVDADTDGGATDLYDARVGGGTPSAQPSALCSGESCQATVAPPPASSAGSEVLHSTTHPGGRARKPCARGRHRAKAGGKTSCVANHPGHRKSQRRHKKLEARIPGSSGIGTP
jgi:hypothetical protein